MDNTEFLKSAVAVVAYSDRELKMLTPTDTYTPTAYEIESVQQNRATLKAFSRQMIDREAAKKDLLSVARPPSDVEAEAMLAEVQHDLDAVAWLRDWKDEDE